MTFGSVSMIRQATLPLGPNSKLRVEEGEQMDGSKVIHFALEAIAQAAAIP